MRTQLGGARHAADQALGHGESMAKARFAWKSFELAERAPQSETIGELSRFWRRRLEVPMQTSRVNQSAACDAVLTRDRRWFSSRPRGIRSIVLSRTAMAFALHGDIAISAASSSPVACFSPLACTSFTLQLCLACLGRQCPRDAHADP